MVIGTCDGTWAGVIIAQIFLRGTFDLRIRKNFKASASLDISILSRYSRRNVSMNITLTSMVVATKGQMSSELAVQEVILNLQSGVYYGLDAVGAFIWKQLQSPRAVAEIRDAMIARYNVDAARAERDLLALLEQLRQTGLIEIKNETRA